MLSNANSSESIDSSVSTTEVDSSISEEQLVQATKERLETVFGDEPTPTDSAADSAAESSVVESAADSAVESSAVESSAVDSTPTDSAADSAAVTLPDNYYRAALHHGWKDEEIKELYQTNPALAKRTFAKMYEDTNRLTREFASIGRLKQQQQQKPVEKPAESKKPEFEGIDVEALRKKYDDDPIVEVIAQQQKQLKAIFDSQHKEDPKEKPQTQLNEAEIKAQIQEEAVIQQQVEQFFNGSDLDSYGDFYGKSAKDDENWNSLTESQQQHRYDVILMADYILAGAESQGRQLSVTDALNRAHLSVSEPIREQIIREDIIAKVSKRSKSLTLPPTSKKKTPIKTTGGVKSEEQLIADTRERLAKAFGS